MKFYRFVQLLLLFIIIVVSTYSVAQCSTNLVQNGDFEAGNKDFSSGYDSCNTANCLIPESYYAVGTNANYFHYAFTGTDHTTGSGNFMIVNGAGTPNTIIWTETISVLKGIDYNFSSWVSSMDESNPALLQFQINGVALGSVFNAPSSTNDWENFAVTWNSADTSSATITILNQNTSLGGNDFGLDDISFMEVCPAPLTWLNVKAELTEDKLVNVHWDVADQKDVNYYQVQRSVNGYKFTTVGSVPALSSVSSYNFTDTPLEGGGNVYYRIAEADYNNKIYSYSKIAQVELDEEIYLYPNPVNAVATIHFASPGVEKIELINAIGQTVLIRENLNSATIDIDLQYLSQGIYTLCIYLQNSIKSFKLIKE